jgi:hypothetical protein
LPLHIVPTTPRYRLSLILLAALLLLLQVWLFRPITADYFPSLDEIAVQGASNPALGAIDPLGWWSQGFHGYFQPFPEWPSTSSDLWRPLVNVYYWASGLAFGDTWADQLLIGYALHALVASLVGYFALVVLRLNRWLAFAAIAIAVLNPAYVLQDALHDPYQIPRALQYPIYQIEVLDALLALLAVLAFIAGRFAWFALVATLALLLKETALVLPLCALAMPGAWWVRGDRRASLRHFACLLAPLLIWLGGLAALMRRFHQSTYIASLRTALHAMPQLPRRLVLWPTGLMQVSTSDLMRALRAHQFASLLEYAAAGIIDLGWWIALAIAARYVFRERGRLLSQPAPEPGAIALVFAGTSLLLALVLLPAEVRFGYLWFALGPAAIFWALGRTRPGAAAAAVLSIALVVPQVHSLGSALSGDSIQAYRLARRSARQLTQLLATLPASTERAYVLDDLADQTSSPQYLARLAGFRGQIVLLNILAPIPGCLSRQPTMPHYRLVSDASAIQLDYRRPACFQAPWNVVPQALLEHDNSVPRGATLTYRYPDLPAQLNTADLADVLSAHFAVRATDRQCLRAGACVWLGFDPQTARYEALSFETASAAQ